MKTGRAGRILCAGLLVLGGTAAVLWACSDTGGIHGTVTESLHGHVLCGSFMGLTRTADPSYVASTNTDVNGDYKFTGLTPDGYAVSAGHMAYQPKTANVTVTAGGDVGKDFVLDPVAANIKADVVSLDQSSGGKTGGWRSVQVKITYQMMCHGPMRLVVWAWGGSPAKPYVIHDSGGTGGYDYSCWLDSTVSPNVTTSGFDTVATLRFPWNTTWVPNGSYTIKAALKCSDPHKDGVDENPDPVAESWVHWAGSPPTATTDGVAGGTTVSISVVNLVITSYRAKDTPLPSHDQDAFLYDPDAASPLCNPSFEVSIDNWATEPMVIRVWMAATAWSDTRPVPDYDPYVDLDVNAAGTYTLTWDGSNPGYPYWEGEWGTWSFDVDLYRLDATATWAIDHFYAKTHDGQSENYDVLVDPVNHHVWWYCDETTTPPGYQFRCNYIVHSDESTQPTAVDLVTLKELTVKAQDSKTGTWTYLNTLHDNIATYPGSGYTTESDTLGTWRTVFTGQTASGAEHRRDHTNPRVLATNQTAFTVRVDLDIANGQGGALLDDDEEEMPGAYTVANLNDSDGNGIADKEHASVVGEEDLTELLIRAPDPDVGGKVKLAVSSGLKLWKNATKSTGEETETEFNTSDLPKTLWVEVVVKSDTLRDKGVTLEYRGATDEVKLTGVWATKTGFGNQLTDLLWDTAGEPLRTTFNLDYGGKFGMQYTSDWVMYGMGMEFTVSPPGIGGESKVKFDVTRQRETTAWSINNGVVVQYSNLTKYWPGRTVFTSDGPTGAQVDKSNDDIGITDEDSTPNDNRVYSIDAPSLQNTGLCDQFIMRFNFLEFVRVGFGSVAPSGETDEGSRCSPKVPWRVRMWLQDNGDNYIPFPGKENSVDEGYLPILPHPTP
jgi:hypothetical protein